LSERFARLCLVHSAELKVVGDSLHCPRGPHVVTEWATVDREKRKVISKANRHALSIVEPEGGPMRKNSVKSGGGASKATRLELSRFTDGAAEELRLRLVNGPWPAAPYRLLVQHKVEGGRSKSGMLSACLSEEEARNRFQAACNEARSMGWKDALSRRSSLTTIPAPGGASLRPARASRAAAR
jgi:hypothetical protein